MRLTTLGFAAIAATLALSTPALAQDNAAFTGVRAEVAAGVLEVSEFNTNNVNYSATLGVDMPLGSNWTLGAETFGGFNDGSDEYGVAARLGYAVSPNTLVFGRLGYSSFDAAQDNEAATVGAGIEHRLGNNVFLTTQYRYVDQGDGAHGALIGLGYRF